MALIIDAYIEFCHDAQTGKQEQLNLAKRIPSDRWRLKQHQQTLADDNDRKIQTQAKLKVRVNNVSAIEHMSQQCSASMRILWYTRLTMCLQTNRVEVVRDVTARRLAWQQSQHSRRPDRKRIQAHAADAGWLFRGALLWPCPHCSSVWRSRKFAVHSCAQLLPFVQGK